MATKKTTATAKKTATKTAKKTVKKATKKVAAKKSTKKVAKKASKKAAKKITPNKVKLAPKTKAAPTVEEIQHAAYLNYLDRIQSGLPGSPELDWTKAQQDLA
jgi:colicin import membrane protein